MINKLNSKFTPCSIVVIFVSILFLIFPDNLPFTYADCASIGASGCPPTGSIIQQSDCTVPGYPIIIDVGRVHYSPSPTRCEQTVSITLTIPVDGCCVYWRTGCSANPAQGIDICFNKSEPFEMICSANEATFEKTVACSSCGDWIGIYLLYKAEMCYYCTVIGQEPNMVFGWAGTCEDL